MSADAAPEGRTGADEARGAAAAPTRRRDVRPLAARGPSLGAHWRDGAASVAFLLISTAATLGLTLTLRLVIDKGVGGRTAGSIDRYFLAAAAVGVVLAVATAGRF